MFLLRIEDIDPARKRTEFVDGLIGDLLWLGLEPDGEIVYQPERLSLYADALERLKEQGLADPCSCTRCAIAEEIASSAETTHGPAGPNPHGNRNTLPPDEHPGRL